MRTIKIDKLNVTGISVRTKNADEINPSTAKIGSLWEKFYAELAPKLDQNSHIYGLYINYESDQTGSFDIVACSDSLTVNNLEKHQINAGKYLKFEGAGDMPQAVVDLWQEVWGYFSSDGCEHTRAFTTDFELYKNEKEIEIYISIL